MGAQCHLANREIRSSLRLAAWVRHTKDGVISLLSRANRLCHLLHQHSAFRGDQIAMQQEHLHFGGGSCKAVAGGGEVAQ
jgi:hypothetical protein